MFVDTVDTEINAINAMFVDAVNAGVCGSMGVKTQHKVTSRPCQEGRLSSIDLVLLKTESKEGAYVDTVDTDLSRTFQIPDEKPSRLSTLSIQG